MIELRSDQMEQIIAHARREAPDEAGGLLAGRGSRIERVYAMKNVEHSPVAYHLDPEEQYRVFMEIETAGWELVGIYHSHPKNEAYPSSTDVELAYYPEAVYLIVSLIDVAHPIVRAFRIKEGTVTEEPM
jgi:proteasome lid subunit RPN8/RPN11